MAGEAKTSQFLLSSATLMIGPAANLYSLNANAHSIGLVKNVQVNSEQGLVELTQGVLNTPVYTVPNSVSVRFSAEVYEYTARNLAYAAGVDASGAGYNAVNVVTNVAANAAADAQVIQVASTANFANGDWAVIQGANSDAVHVSRVNVANSGNLTLLSANIPFAVVTNIACVWKVLEAAVGLPQSTPTLCAKLVGVMPERSEPIVVLVPKIRITRGLALSFQTENFSNMPFEFGAYSLTTTDALYANIGANRPALIYKG